MQRQSINWPAHTRKHLHRHLGMHKPTWVVLAECLIQLANNSICSTKQDFKIFFCLLEISEQLHVIHFVKSYKSHQPQGLRKQQATRVIWLHLKLSDCWECPELEKEFHSTCLLWRLALMHVFQDSHWRSYFYIWPAASCIRLSICNTGSILLKNKTAESWKNIVMWQSWKGAEGHIGSNCDPGLLPKNPSQITATRCRGYIKPESLRPVHIYSLCVKAGQDITP